MKSAPFRLVPLLVIFAACSVPDQSIPPVRLTIHRGATLTAIADSLSANEIVGSARLFKTYVRMTGRQRQIQAGTYDFRLGTPMREVLEALISGREATDLLTLPEGLMLTEVADIVNAQLGIDTDAFAAAVRDSALRSEVGVSSETLEGYLYPSTYYVRVGATAREIVRQMILEFQARWRPEWNDRLIQLRMSRHEIVTLASIIEGEIQVRSESKTVSSVYHNRLRQGRRLQADPTVIYSLGLRRRLFERDYSFRSPYNTYLINGLPPGPVNQPSVTSIEAALEPADTEFLYFVAGTDGRHVFTRTYEEHLAAIRRIRNPAAP